MDSDLRSRFRSVNDIGPRPDPIPMPRTMNPRPEVLPPPRPARRPMPAMSQQARPVPMNPMQSPAQPMPRPAMQPQPVQPQPSMQQQPQNPLPAPGLQQAYEQLHSAPMPSTQPMPQQEHQLSSQDHAPRTRSLPTLRKPALVAGIAIILLASGGFGWVSLHSAKASAVPAATLKSVSFPILYPAKLPAGFTVQPNSFNTSQNIVLYSATNSAGIKIAFSVQKPPATFDFNSFYKQGMNDAAPFSTPLGEAAIGTTVGHPFGSLHTDQSWVLVSSLSGQIQSSDIRLILQNMKIVSQQ